MSAEFKGIVENLGRGTIKWMDEICNGVVGWHPDLE